VTPRVFRSSVDGWIRLVLVLAIVVEAVALSSPAPSLDRLCIRYRGGRFGRSRQVLVSPADKARFLRAVGMDKGEARA
jgi:hypothetical protein